MILMSEWEIVGNELNTAAGNWKKKKKKNQEFCHNKYIEMLSLRGL